MRTAPRLRFGPTVRVPSLFAGFFVIGFAIVCLLKSRLGLPPWDVLHQGIARHSPLTIGTASIVVGLVVLVVAWVLGQPPGWGTVANAIVIGLAVDLFLAIDAIGGLVVEPLALRMLLVVVGVALFGIGTAMYIGAGVGAGPRDSLMLSGARRTGARIAVVRFSMEATVVLTGFLLGGTVGIGTLAFALLIGPAVEGCFWLLTRLGLAATTPVPEIGDGPALTDLA
ncbi:MAG TPA: hypothetical protein VFK59_00740 [Actinomycetota bacterium]|jgi:uncharacterized membrane protein YczE|nr:hypothetical protein [Actinomycetota bacterium]